MPGAMIDASAAQLRRGADLGHPRRSDIGHRNAILAGEIAAGLLAVLLMASAAHADVACREIVFPYVRCWDSATGYVVSTISSTARSAIATSGRLTARSGRPGHRAERAARGGRDED
jgi:hypothetical protein